MSWLIKKNLRFFLALLGFYFVIFLPTLHAGFYDDDAGNSLVNGAILLSHSSNAWVYSKQYFLDTFYAGRFFPLIIFSEYLFFSLVNTPLLYQIVHVFLLFASIFTMLWLVYLLTSTWRASLAFLVFFPLCWSIRNYNDPISSFALLMPMVSSFIMLSTAFFIQKQKTQHTYWLALSLLSFVLGLLTYELGTIAFFTIAILALVNKRNVKEAFFACAPFLLILLVYLAICALARHRATVIYPGITVGKLDVSFCLAFLHQLSASFPLSYIIFGMRPIISRAFFQAFLPAHPIYFVIFPIFLSLSFICFYHTINKIKFEKKQCIHLMVLALCFLLIPSLMIAINPKYREMLDWGVGYLPVYLQYVGSAFFFLCLLSFFHEKLCGKKNRIIFSLLLSFFMLLIFIFNLQMVFNRNNIHQYPRELLIASLKKGLIENLPQNAELIGTLSLYNTPDFYRLYGNRVVDVLNVRSPEQLSPRALQDPGQKRFVMDYAVKPFTHDGFVLLGSLDTVTYKKLTPLEQKNSKKPLGFYSGGGVYAPNQFNLRDPRLFILTDGKEKTTAEILSLLQSRLLTLSPQLSREIDQQLSSCSNSIQECALFISLPKGIYVLKNTWRY